MTSLDRESLIGRLTIDKLIAAAVSMYDALWCIANMQIQKETNKAEVLALCMAIASIELEKWSSGVYIDVE